MIFIDLVIFAVGHGQSPTDGKRDQILMNMEYRIVFFENGSLGCTERPTSKINATLFLPFWNQSAWSLSSK